MLLIKDEWKQLTKNLALIKRRNKVSFFFWKAPGLNKFGGLKNIRFRILSNNKIRLFIKLPFLYLMNDNNNFEFGLPNLYFKYKLWE